MEDFSLEKLTSGALGLSQVIPKPVSAITRLLGLDFPVGLLSEFAPEYDHTDSHGPAGIEESPPYPRHEKRMLLIKQK